MLSLHMKEINHTSAAWSIAFWTGLPCSQLVKVHTLFLTRNPFIRVSTWDLNKLRNKYLIFEILRNFRSSSYGAKKLKYLNFSSSKEQICRKLRKSQSLNRNFMELLSVFPVHCTQHLSNCFLCYFLPTCVMICRVVFLNKLVFD